MEELKPVGWQYKAKDKNIEVWIGCASGSVEILKEEGFETRALYAIPDGYVVVPLEPTEEMWSGLARHIMMWLDYNRKTGMALHSHLEMLGIEVPEWLSDEIPNVDHVPSKGNRVAAIYKAMIADAMFPRGSVVDEEV